MENSQIIGLVAIAISLFSLGLSFVAPISLQSDIRDLQDNLIEQSQTIKSLNSQLNDSTQTIKQQDILLNNLRSQQNTSQSQISNLQTTVINMENQINSLENRLIVLEQRNNVKPPTNLSCDQSIPNGQLNSNTPTLNLTNIPAVGLIAEWKFENNVLDTSGHGNNGMICGGTSFTNGKIGKALSFDGLSGVVSVPNNPSLNFGSNKSFSISLWMKSTQSSGAGMILIHRLNNDGQYKGYSIEDFSGHLLGRIRDGSGHDVPVFSTIDVNDGVFHHITFIIDRPNHLEKLYIDNVLRGESDISSVEDINSETNLLFGGQAPPSAQIDYFNGIIDQIRIYDHILLQNEIQNLFNEPNG